jgi:hypothetical protein
MKQHEHVMTVSSAKQFSTYKSMYKAQHASDEAPSHYILRKVLLKIQNKKQCVYLKSLFQNNTEVLGLLWFVPINLSKELSTQLSISKFCGDKAHVLNCICLQPFLDCRTEGVVRQKITVE